MSDIAAIILAAGKGTRMRSSLPKVLHTIANKSMLEWVLEAVRAAGIDQQVVLLSPDLTDFGAFLSHHSDLTVSIQNNRLGTGDAVASAAYAFKDVSVAPFASGRLLQGPTLHSKYVLITAGDVPALSAETLKVFMQDCIQKQAALSVLAMRVPNPHGYGRLVMQDELLLKIVEEKDASSSEKQINICNTGVLFAEVKTLFSLIAQLTPNNAQKEYYLTDCIALARQADLKVTAYIADDWQNFAGVNDPEQLAKVEALMRGSSQKTGENLK